ncbi:hypothetical protein TNIN_377871 [Trichonephila inaurata madagascariensis]|uniref:Uncharacterized protein n=1 Tax=Trichonephila inaurata madagascariensis TaxID=2747483 RepID=A0A8X6XKW5_9ARAC|nr:hypothetical protein TNIN_384771 [Trichonephila inaurata madagascariensis]GFY58621.1 hypothetical protein TNIN_377871 [Trichonephila inaurata madagascariensis]
MKLRTVFDASIHDRRALEEEMRLEKERYKIMEEQKKQFLNEVQERSDEDMELSQATLYLCEKERIKRQRKLKCGNELDLS